MSQVYTRTEQIADKVYEIKLLLDEWKVLFALDGKMDDSAIARFLQLDAFKVESALNRLKELALVAPAGETAPEPDFPEEIVGLTPEEEMPSEPEEISLPPEEPEPAAEGPSEVIGEPSEPVEVEDEFADAADELEELFPGAEEVSAEPETPGTEMEDSLFEDLENDAAESLDELKFEEFGEEPVEEQAKSSEDSSAAGGEEELDQLINDLLMEEEATEAPAPTETETTESSFTVETGSAAPETEPAAETENADEFDLGDIFESELEETEQSLDEMLGGFEEEAAVAEEEAEEGGEVAAPQPVAETGQKTVLVVDDSVVIRKMVEIALENENYNIVSVANGKDALAYLDEKEADIVILDIMLPDVNGLDVLKAIKASKSIPVVMLSAKDTPRETSKARELGADEFIPKPFKDEDLVNKIRELIGA